jgi:hypothetical protein
MQNYEIGMLIALTNRYIKPTQIVILEQMLYPFGEPPLSGGRNQAIAIDYLCH